ncbi:hypothetical protein BC826DRAFT_907706, partial [Russula brevipes]
AKIWKSYQAKANKHDKELTETWKEETGAMLIFTGLFSAVVSAFIIETYKTLLPDSGTATVDSSHNCTSIAPPAGTQVTFTPPGVAIRVNILMVLSLFLSLTCALMSTLIQQWSRSTYDVHRPAYNPTSVAAFGHISSMA